MVLLVSWAAWCLAVLVSLVRYNSMPMFLVQGAEVWDTSHKAPTHSFIFAPCTFNFYFNNLSYIVFIVLISTVKKLYNLSCLIINQSINQSCTTCLEPSDLSIKQAYSSFTLTLVPPTPDIARGPFFVITDTSSF